MTPEGQKQPLYELEAIQWDRRTHQSFHVSLEEAKAESRRWQKSLVIIWDHGADPIAPVFWDRVHLGDAFHRNPILEYEAWILDQQRPRAVAARAPNPSQRQLTIHGLGIEHGSWVDIPATGPHVVETPAQRIHYMNGKRVGRQCLVPETGEWGEIEYGV